MKVLLRPASIGLPAGRVACLVMHQEIPLTASKAAASSAKLLAKAVMGAFRKPMTTSRWHHYAMAIAVSFAITLLAYALIALNFANPIDFAMIYLLSVVLVAVRLGSGPSMVASVTSVALFDYFLVPPIFSFNFDDSRYLITFGIMLIVAQITSQLTVRLKREGESAVRHMHETQSLYQLAIDLSGASSLQDVAKKAGQYAATSLDAKATLLIPDESGPLIDPTERQSSTAGQPGAEAATSAPDVAPDDQTINLPLLASGRTCGVLVIAFNGSARSDAKALQQQLDALASLLATVIERVRYAALSEKALLCVESERFRSSLLSAISHDLRTPLGLLVGLSESLAQAKPRMPPMEGELAITIRDQSRRLCDMVVNLLDMARMQATGVHLNKEWQSLEDLLGVSLQGLEPLLASQTVEVRLPSDLPLLHLDPILMERVLHNLLKNALTYAPGSTISVEAHVKADLVEVAVLDTGPGLAPGTEHTLFDWPGERVRRPANTRASLGLSICRAAVEAHEGCIWASNRLGGGAAFSFTLPRGTPPALQAEESTEAGS